MPAAVNLHPSPVLGERDYQELGNLLGYDSDKIKHKLRSRTGINSWTLTQLKEVIKFFRSKLRDPWGQNWPQWLSISGRKAQLVDVVLQAVQYRNPNPNAQTHPNAYAAAPYQDTADPYANQTAAHAQARNLQQVRQAIHHGNPVAGANAVAYRNVYGAAPASFFPQNYTPEIPDVTQICGSAEFNEGRSPFYTIEKRYTACPVLPSRRSKFDVQLDQATVEVLLSKEGKKQLHLRLFDSVNNAHHEWNQYCGVSCQINQIYKQYQSKSNKTGVKKRGFHCVKPLDISPEAALHMEIILYSQHTFTGIATVELVTVHPVAEIADRVKRRCREEKKCEICSSTHELLRCSRCKAAWYCGVEHQQQDWIYHQKICHPYQPKPKLKRLHQLGDGGDGDEIVCGESRVSLRCPLTICRIQTPVRGVDCLHPQCMDLQGFLGFSNRCGVWQCPVCTKALKFDTLVIDEKMVEILKKTDDEVDQVRLFPNGTYTPISLEEVREEDRKSQMVRASKKRKKTQQALENTGAPGVPAGYRPAPAPVQTQQYALAGPAAAYAPVPQQQNMRPAPSGGSSMADAICLD